MEPYKIQLIETVIAFVLFFIIKFSISRLVKKIRIRFSYHPERIKITNRIVSILLIIILTVFLIVIWGVDQSKLLLFASTTLTILGVAFFAQWSIISNITSTLIIFFNHPIKIGDSLTIMDKEFHIEGTLIDIGFFFLTIKTEDDKEVTIPSNVFMQKMIKK